MRYLAIIIIGLAGAFFVSEYKRELRKTVCAYESVMDFLIYVRSVISEGAVSFASLIKGYGREEFPLLEMADEKNVGRAMRRERLQCIDFNLFSEDESYIKTYLAGYGESTIDEERRRLNDVQSRMDAAYVRVKTASERYCKSAGIIYVSALSSLALIFI